jgi:hypothetical protein
MAESSNPEVRNSEMDWHGGPVNHYRLYPYRLITIFPLLDRVKGATPGGHPDTK